MAYDNGSDLFAYGQSAGGSATGTAPGYTATSANAPGFQEGYWGGDAGQIGYDENGNQIVIRQTGAQQDVNNFNQRADAANQRQAFRPNYGGYNAAMGGFQYGQGQAQQALDLQRNAAQGRAPSAAQIAGQQAIDQSTEAETAAAASARGGPLAQATQMRSARQGANAFRQGAVATLLAGRAREMEGARGQYGGTALAYGRNQLGQGSLELGRTGQEQQGEQFQRGLNQNQEQYYIDKAQQTKQAQLAADFARSGQQYQASTSGRDEDRADRAQSWNQSMQAINAGTSMATAANPYDPNNHPSDVRTKNPIEPADQRGIIRKNPYGEGRGHDDAIDIDAETNFDADQYDADQKRKLEARTDIQRGDPYDPEMNAMLDDRAHQNGAPPAHWLEEFRGQESTAYPQQPIAQARSRPHDYVPGEFDDWRNDTPGPGDTYSDEQSKRPIKEPLGQYRPRRNEGREVAVSEGPSGDASDQELRRKMGGDYMYSDAAAKDAAFEAGRKQGAYEANPNRERPEVVNREAKSDAATVAKQQEQVPRAEAREVGGAKPQVMGPKATGEDSIHQNLQNAGWTTPSDRAVPDPRRHLALNAFDVYSDDRAKEEAARAMKGSEYTYKGEYLPPDQEPGEVNVGPMAQNLEKNPLTATAVKKDPNGMRMVNIPKMVKVQATVIDHLQEQIDDLKGGRRARRL